MYRMPQRRNPFGTPRPASMAAPRGTAMSTGLSGVFSSGGVAPRLTQEQMSQYFDPSVETGVSQDRDTSKAFANPFSTAAEMPSLAPRQRPTGAFDSAFGGVSGSFFPGAESTKGPEGIGSMSFEDNLTKGIDIYTKESAPQLQGGDLIRGSQADLEKAEAEWQKASDTSGNVWMAILATMFPQFGTVLDMNMRAKEKKAMAAQNKYDAAYWSVFGSKIANEEAERAAKAIRENTDYTFNKQKELAEFEAGLKKDSEKNFIEYRDDNTGDTIVLPVNEQPRRGLTPWRYVEKPDKPRETSVSGYVRFPEDQGYGAVLSTGDVKPIRGVPLGFMTAEGTETKRQLEAAKDAERLVIGQLASGVKVLSGDSGVLERTLAARMKVKPPTSYADAVAMLVNAGVSDADARRRVREVAKTVFGSRISHDFLPFNDIEAQPGGTTAATPAGNTGDARGGNGISVIPKETLAKGKSKGN